jgi:gas vesicle protein
MKVKVFSVIALFMACVMLLPGCGAGKAESSKAAIDNVKTMQTVQEKTDYLVSQAKAFYNSKDFQGAVDIAQYVLRYLDKDSQQAKNLLEEAKNKIQANAQALLDQAKKDFSINK